MKNALSLQRDSDEKLLQLATTIDEFEGYSHVHSLRISILSKAIAEKFNFSKYDSLTLQQAAFIHDIGEFVMNRDYIKTNRALSNEERIDMQRHPVIGEQEAAKRGMNRAVQLLVRWHHEWWDGTGYPDALHGDEIPLSARILRVADTFSALIDIRPYRTAMPETEARQFLIEWAGIQFDPKVVKVFLEVESLLELKSPANIN